MHLVKRCRQFIVEHGWILVVVMVATWLRVWQLDDKAILFGDAGRDLLAAHSAVFTKQLPLLGIPSSVPRFHQGPISVWISMVLIILAGPKLFPISIVFALLSIAAVIGLYELVVLTVNKRVAIWAAALLAVSPLAVAHGRMPYHITPIPLFLLFWLAACWWWWQGQGKKGLWLVVLTWALVFQFELALAPLLLLIPYIWWRLGRPDIRRQIPAAIGAGLIGLWPQLVYDLTHQFAHLGGFGLWMGYRTAKAGLSLTDHLHTVLTVGFPAAALYGSRVISVAPVSLVAVVLNVIGLWPLARAAWQRKLPPSTRLVELAGVSLTVLFWTYMIHGSPSEAYFPPFTVMLAIIFAWALEIVPLKRWLKWSVIGGVMCLNTVSIVQANFFVSTTNAFNYGPSTGEQRQVLEWLVTQPQPVELRTTAPGGIFPAYFDNLRWLALQYPLQIGVSPNQVYFVEPPSSSLRGYPGASWVHFDTLDVYAVPARSE